MRIGGFLELALVGKLLETVPEGKIAKKTVRYVV